MIPAVIGRNLLAAVSAKSVATGCMRPRYWTVTSGNALNKCGSCRLAPILCRGRDSPVFAILHHASTCEAIPEITESHDANSSDVRTVANVNDILRLIAKRV